MIRRLVFIAVIASALFAATVSLFTLQQPLVFAVERAVNHFYHRGDGRQQQLAGWIIGTGLVRSWDTARTEPTTETPFSLYAQAASPDLRYPYQTYSANGRPAGLFPAPFLPPPGSARVDVATTAELFAALRNARAGDIITIAPGTYPVTKRSIPVLAAGNADRPIYLRAEQFGQVTLSLDTLEGFHVMAPFWVFENLAIRGACARHSRCEHAFHVVGKGKSFTLRNSAISNFNAPIKVNLQSVNGKHYYADDGLLEYNRFFNDAPRDTGNPVTLLNIDAADHWVVRGNYIADFAKNGGDHISYGAFMKGNGRGGVFERNLVICEHRLPADQGIRIGLSFGGGGTADRFCKGQDCAVEFTAGAMRNNIVINCSRDVGMYLNRAAQSEIHHNLLYNTLGIDVRFARSSASITHNIVSGRIRERDQGKYHGTGNLVFRNCVGSTRSGCELDDIYQAPGRADFRLQSLDHPLWEAIEAPARIEVDFCGLPLRQQANAGPIQYANGLDCLLPSTAATGR